MILIKYRGREKKRPSTIDFKAFVFFFVYIYTLFLSDVAQGAQASSIIILTRQDSQIYPSVFNFTIAEY